MRRSSCDRAISGDVDFEHHRVQFLGMTDRTPSERRAWLAGLKREAMQRRESLLSYVGPNGRTPLLSIRVEPGLGGTRRHVSSEATTIWYEPAELYMATFQGPDGEPKDEVLVEEEDALRWAFALGWGLEKD